MTRRLYYTDSYLSQFSARVTERLEVEGQPALVLDQTAFYPTGGGQPNDTGELAGETVIDVQVRKDDAAVLHILGASATVEPGDSVSGYVDFVRRFDLMQQHTGQHILSRAFVLAGEATTTGFHLSANTLTIDLDQADLTADLVSKVEQLANRTVTEDRQVIAAVVPLDALDDVRVRRMPDTITTDGLRVIEIEGYDKTACGGTHVQRTGEIGLIKILHTENYKGGSRVTFISGGRALADYQSKHACLAGLAADLSVRHEEVAEAVSRLRSDLAAAQTVAREAREKLLRYEASDLLGQAVPIGGCLCVITTFESRDADDLRLLALHLTAGSGILALLGAAGEKARVVCARSADLPFDMTAMLNRVLARLGGGRGGGKAELAQGGGIPASPGDLQTALTEEANRLVG